MHRKNLIWDCSQSPRDDEVKRNHFLMNLYQHFRRGIFKQSAFSRLYYLGCLSSQQIRYFFELTFRLLINKLTNRPFRK